jgi:hypothetical protein
MVLIQAWGKKQQESISYKPCCIIQHFKNHVHITWVILKITLKKELSEFSLKIQSRINSEQQKE